MFSDYSTDSFIKYTDVEKYMLSARTVTNETLSICVRKLRKNNITTFVTQRVPQNFDYGV